MKKLIASLLFIAAMSVPSFATTYWAGGGSDANSCMTASGASDPGSSNRKATVASGVGCLSGGDTLMIASGTYTSSTSISSVPSGPNSGSPTIIRAISIVTCVAGTTCSPNVVLKPTSGLAAGCCVGFLDGKNHVKFQGIAWDCGSASNCQPFYITYADVFDDLTFEDSVFRQGSCIWVDAMTTTDCSGLEAQGSTSTNLVIRRSQGINNGTTTSFTHGFYIAVGGATIEDSYAIGNGGFGFHLYCGGGGCANETVRRSISTGNAVSGHGGCGFIVQNVTNAQVYNNIEYGDANSCAFQYHGSCTSCLLSFNTTPDSIEVTMSGVTVSSNIRGSYSGSSSETTPLTYGSGLFVNAATHNYHLAADDVSGGTTSGTVTTDYDGVSRSSPPDRGAFEFVSGCAANRLKFTNQPAATVRQGQNLGTVQVSVMCSDNTTLVTTSSASISIAKNSGCQAGQTLNGTLTQSASSGVASFSDLNITGLGSCFLDASSSGLTGVTSSSILVTDVVPGNGRVRVKGRKK